MVRILQLFRSFLEQLHGIRVNTPETFYYHHHHSMKLRRIIYLGASALLFLIVFVIDVIRKNVELYVGGLNLTRDILVIGAFALIYIYLDAKKVHLGLTPIKRLGLVMIYSVIVGLFCLAIV
ncbi:MAG: hypothetical protein AAB344_07530, partial [Bacteroidota bacterium]